MNVSAFGPLRYSRTVYGTRFTALQLLREHQRVAVGVVERRQPHHVLDLRDLAVEADALALEVRARGVDVLDREGERRAAALLDLLGLADPDQQPVDRRLELRPAPGLELEDDLSPSTSRYHASALP